MKNRLFVIEKTVDSRYLGFMNNTQSKRILVVGASNGTGRAAVEECLARGHAVTAFARSAARMAPRTGLTLRTGDAMVAADIDASVAGHDAVIVTLGIHESPVRVRLGIRKTPIDVRSQGTANVIAAMQRHGVHRLIVQSTYGVGASEGKLPFAWTMIFALLLRPQIVDTARQEDLVKASALDWTLIQPVGLTDAAITRPTFVSEDSATRSMEVSRRQVAEVLADVASRSIHVHASLAVSS